MKTLKGRAWVFGDNLDVDYEIVPVRLIRRIPRDLPGYEEELGKHCMALLDPEFPKKVRKGDFIVAGRNMGCGQAHITGPQALKGVGISAVIAESLSRNFFRNSFHIGLPVVQYKGITQNVKQGDELEVDLAAGTITNLTTAKILEFNPVPTFLLEIVEAGGLFPYLEAQLHGTNVLR